MVTVNELRKAGYKVYVTHRRRYTDMDEYRESLSKKEADKACLYPDEMLSCGGSTTVTIYLPERTISKTVNCHFKDQYNRRQGRNKALGLVLSEMSKLGISPLTPAEIGV